MNNLNLRAWDLDRKTMIRAEHGYAEDKTRGEDLRHSYYPFMFNFAGPAIPGKNFKQMLGVKLRETWYYEGDIVDISVRDGSSRREVISFGSGCFLVNKSQTLVHALIHYDVKLIGNIYENPKEVEK